MFSDHYHFSVVSQIHCADTLVSTRFFKSIQQIVLSLSYWESNQSSFHQEKDFLVLSSAMHMVFIGYFYCKGNFTDDFSATRRKRHPNPKRSAHYKQKFSLKMFEGRNYFFPGNLNFSLIVHLLIHGQEKITQALLRFPFLGREKIRNINRRKVKKKYLLV